MAAGGDGKPLPPSLVRGHDTSAGPGHVADRGEPATAGLLHRLQPAGYPVLDESLSSMRTHVYAG